MKRMKITHKTVYYYHTPVTFGPHHALLRPREGHDLHIDSSLLEIEPKADVRWQRDIPGFTSLAAASSSRAVLVARAPSRLVVIETATA